MQISVTQAHIDKSMRHDSISDPIANAILDAFPAARHVSIDLEEMRFYVHGMRQTYINSPEVQARILRFDVGGDIEPFDFNLN